uniref:Uncharacterized protein n=1 Tax=Heterorhabditis bacteriophora TaxID=37862 RepID=A0A1I7X3Y4_HETBA
MSGIGGLTEEFLSHRVSVRIKTAFGTELLLTMNTKPVITKDFRSATLSGCDKQFLRQEEIFLSNLFLWLRDSESPPTKENIVHYRFNRIPFGVTAKPIAAILWVFYIQIQKTT